VRAAVPAAAAIVAAAALVPYEWRRFQPVIELRLLRRSRFAGVEAIALLSSSAFSGVLFLSCLYLQQAEGRDVVAAGIFLAPMGVMTAVCAPIAGRVIGRVGPRRPVLWAGGLLAAGGAMLSLSVASGSDLGLLLGLATFAAGYGFVNPPLNYVAAEDVPREQAGLAAAMTSTSRLVGGSLGVAVTGSLLAARASGPVAESFAAASAPCWWAAAAFGLAVLVVGAATTRGLGGEVHRDRLAVAGRPAP
jgi:predicted MFS family arabinose efflux permease